MTQAATERPTAPEYKCHVRISEGSFARYCRSLVAVDVDVSAFRDLTIVPNEAFVVSVKLSQGSDPLMHAQEAGLLPESCTYRRELLRYQPSGNCRSLLALLTPEGAIALGRGSAMPAGEPRQPLVHLIDRVSLAKLESKLATTPDVSEQLERFGTWLEARLVEHVNVPWQARRVARIASSMFAAPVLNIERLAATEQVSKRQLERDFRYWLNATPKQTTMIARVQSAARLGLQGAMMTEVAQRLGFSDQPHLNRTVRSVLGVTPMQMSRAPSTSLCTAFRVATGGGLVYL
jgi:AraC-like DNA-binding protein